MKFISFFCFVLLNYALLARAELVESESHTFEVQTVVRGLAHPWSLAFLPDDRMLVTERPGRLRLIERGKLVKQPIAGLPTIRQHGQGGLMDVVIHPDFENNQYVYLAYAGKIMDGLQY